MHLAYAPLLVGSGDRLFDDLEDVPSGYEITDLSVLPPPYTLAWCAKT